MPSKFDPYHIKELISEQLFVEAETIYEGSRLIEDLGADSLDLTEIVMHIEEDYQLNIRENEAAEFRTVGQIISYVREHFKQ